VKLLAVVLVGALLAGCSRNIQNKEAVRDAVVEYLAARSSQTGLDMKTMDVEVTALSFRSDEAQATLAFRPKALPSSAAMHLNYTLDRSGNKWVVRGSGTLAPGQDAHSGGEAPQALPPNHPPVEPGKASPKPGELPAGHPPVQGSK
jgi:outer membrane murein-binding lipoprotein Lpp